MDNLKKHREIIEENSRWEFDRLKLLGENNISAKRNGVLRKGSLPGHFEFNSPEIQKYGLHPTEVQLIARAEEYFKRKSLHNPTKVIPGSIFRRPDFTATGRLMDEDFEAYEKESAFLRGEGFAIDKVWSQLNVKLLDEFYAYRIKSIDLKDFEFIFDNPLDSIEFPFSSGKWTVRSKKWGLKIDNTYRPYYGVSASKHEALSFLLDAIEGDNKKCAAPFDPFDQDV